MSACTIQLHTHNPGIPQTLSHALSPIIPTIFKTHCGPQVRVWLASIRAIHEHLDRQQMETFKALSKLKTLACMI